MLTILQTPNQFQECAPFFFFFFFFRTTAVDNYRRTARYDSSRPNPFIKCDTVSSLFRDAPPAKIHHNPNTILASKEHLLVSKLAN